MYGCVFHKEDGFCEKFSDDRCKSYCVMGPCQYAIPSNADRTRSMTDEKLAETYAGGCPNGDRLNCGKYYSHGGRDCFNCWLDWLQSPVEEVQDGT